MLCDKCTYGLSVSLTRCCLCGAAVGEDELRHSLGLAAHTTGKGKVALDANTRAIEVFMCSVVSRHACRNAACGEVGLGRYSWHVCHRHRHQHHQQHLHHQQKQRQQECKAAGTSCGDVLEMRTARHASQGVQQSGALAGQVPI
eukprot:GHRQ01035083.1.p1 GENE.GHRQ01035083.1~~GHRQ01035083.1.p1  ORF type:complete len:144 (-),score=29.68 GHRQ01035083.1:322-753(-)